MQIVSSRAVWDLPGLEVTCRTLLSAVLSRFVLYEFVYTFGLHNILCHRVPQLNFVLSEKVHPLVCCKSATCLFWRSVWVLDCHRSNIAKAKKNKLNFQSYYLHTDPILLKIWPNFFSLQLSKLILRLRDQKLLFYVWLSRDRILCRTLWILVLQSCPRGVLGAEDKGLWGGR